MAGRVWVLVGASGTGKTSLAKQLPERLAGIRRFVTCTTRAPRPGEREGIDYRYVSNQAFDDLIAANGLVEWTRYGGARYGLPIDQFDALSQGDLIGVLDIEGVHHLRERLGNERVRAVFLASPRNEVLAGRMRSRGSSESEIAARLELVPAEQAQAGICDHVLDTSSTFETVLGQLEALVNPSAPQ